MWHNYKLVALIWFFGNQGCYPGKFSWTKQGVYTLVRKFPLHLHTAVITMNCTVLTTVIVVIFFIGVVASQGWVYIATSKVCISARQTFRTLNSVITFILERWRLIWAVSAQADELHTCKSSFGAPCFPETMKIHTLCPILTKFGVVCGGISDMFRSDRSRNFGAMVSKFPSYW